MHTQYDITNTMQLPALTLCILMGFVLKHVSFCEHFQIMHNEHTEKGVLARHMDGTVLHRGERN